MEWYRMSGGGTDTSDATATASNILSGKTAYVNDNKITGTMANKSGTTVTASSVSQDSDYVNLTVPSTGYYSTSSKIRALLSNINKEPSFTVESVSITKSNSSINFTYTVKIPANKKGILIIDCLSFGTISISSLSGSSFSTITNNSIRVDAIGGYINTLCRAIFLESSSSDRYVTVELKASSNITTAPSCDAKFITY